MRKGGHSGGGRAWVGQGMVWGWARPGDGTWIWRRGQGGGYLDVHLVIRGSVDGAVQSKANHEDALVDREPNGQTCGSTQDNPQAGKSTQARSPPGAPHLRSWALEASHEVGLTPRHEAPSQGPQQLCSLPVPHSWQPWSPIPSTLTRLSSPVPSPAPCPPDAVTGAAVAPAAFHLLEAVDAALLPAEAAARPVDEVHAGLGVDGEVQEEADHLAVHKDA